MKTIEQYQCEVCLSTYTERATAQRCEAQSLPGPFVAVGDIVFAGAGFGWFNGDARWVSNRAAVERQRQRGQPCPRGNDNCFDVCCTYRFYYVVTAIDLVVEDLYEAGARHRTRYHVATKAMRGGYQSGFTYDRGHKLLTKTRDLEIQADARDLLGQKATHLL